MPISTWTQMSIDLANQQNYLDLLFRVYPTIPEDCRDVNDALWNEITTAFQNRNNTELIKELLKLKLFPVKDSYVAYLRRDRSAIERNPQTVNRLAGRIYDLGMNDLFERCSLPKETNRQIGPLFKRWLNNGALGLRPVPYAEFEAGTENAIMDGSDSELMRFAHEHLGYDREKGLDFLGRFNGRYVIGEAKFLTDFGGHQAAQFEDALSTLNTPCQAIKIAILDGVCYIPCRRKICREIRRQNSNIMSALVLREFLYQV